MPFKNINMPGWSKGKFALFQMPETGGTVAGICPKADPPPHNQGVRAFIDRVGGGGGTCRNSRVILNSHLQLVISGLTSIILFVFRYS